MARFGVWSPGMLAQARLRLRDGMVMPLTSDGGEFSDHWTPEYGGLGAREFTLMYFYCITYHVPETNI